MRRGDPDGSTRLKISPKLPTFTEKRSISHCDGGYVKTVQSLSSHFTYSHFIM